MEKLIDIQPTNSGERWIQKTLNRQYGLGWSALFFVAGLILIVIYGLFYQSNSQGSVFLLLGVGGLCASLLYYERYHARKIIERLQSYVEIPNGEQDAGHQDLTRRESKVP